MDFETLANLGWREGLMAIVALLAIYMAIAFWRMYRLCIRRLVTRPLSPSPQVWQSPLILLRSRRSPCRNRPPHRSHRPRHWVQRIFRFRGTNRRSLIRRGKGSRHWKRNSPD